jgi:hypothetical protein
VHQRGKAALKRRDLPAALELLQLADAAFRLAQSDFVRCIDNPAYLCLDIVW